MAIDGIEIYIFSFYLRPYQKHFLPNSCGFYFIAYLMLVEPQYTLSYVLPLWPQEPAQHVNATANQNPNPHAAAALATPPARWRDGAWMGLVQRLGFSLMGFATCIQNSQPSFQFSTMAVCPAGTAAAIPSSLRGVLIWKDNSTFLAPGARTYP